MMPWLAGGGLIFVTAIGLWWFGHGEILIALLVGFVAGLVVKTMWDRRGAKG